MQNLQIFLDEHLDIRLKFLFDKAFIVFTAKDKKWQGKLNGELLQLLIKNSINIFVTNDKNLRYQQNTKKLNLNIIELNAITNYYEITAPLIIEINKYLLSNRFRHRQKAKNYSYIIWQQ